LQLGFWGNFSCLHFLIGVNQVNNCVFVRCWLACCRCLYNLLLWDGSRGLLVNWLRFNLICLAHEVRSLELGLDHLVLWWEMRLHRLGHLLRWLRLIVLWGDESSVVLIDGVCVISGCVAVYFNLIKIFENFRLKISFDEFFAFGSGKFISESEQQFIFLAMGAFAYFSEGIFEIIQIIVSEF